MNDRNDRRDGGRFLFTGFLEQAAISTPEQEKHKANFQ
jgi:hypothetical protein